jgi:hypothetical protein
MQCAFCRALIFCAYPSLPLIPSRRGQGFGASSTANTLDKFDSMPVEVGIRDGYKFPGGANGEMATVGK